MTPCEAACPGSLVSRLRRPAIGTRVESGPSRPFRRAAISGLGQEEVANREQRGPAGATVGEALMREELRAGPP